MRVKGAIVFMILLLAAFCGIVLPALADDFKVTWSTKGLFNESVLEDSPDIKVDFSSEISEDEEATTVAIEVLYRELEGGDTSRQIVYVLDSIDNDGDLWYLNFRWEYASSVKQGVPYRNYFYFKIDLRKNTVIYTRSLDVNRQDAA